MLGTLCHVGEDGCAACCADQHGGEQHLFHHCWIVNEADGFLLPGVALPCRLSTPLEFIKSSFFSM